jgi:hypothetical protein
MRKEGKMTCWTVHLRDEGSLGSFVGAADEEDEEDDEAAAAEEEDDEDDEEEAVAEG